ncbi:hypothetical protein E2C01_086854 [Portunus trituberculatus]|uniref:CUB domain-containing protein n=1 Tax=Portunus trituberculatus TaxID=210409 RepID=A0A5B7JAV0_PORTR|nr:hypothetical protein [Portunus trituberculatus]
MQGLISNENITEERLNYTITYNHPIDCTWVIRVNPDEKVRRGQDDGGGGSGGGGGGGGGSSSDGGCC